MAGIEVRQRGVILTGQGGAVTARVLRRWLAGVFRVTRDYARGIAPVLTGRYRSSLIYRTHQRGAVVSGEMYSTDIPGKVRVIEYGFPPRPLARQPKKGPTRMGKGRKPVYVFRRTEQHTRGLFRTQTRLLETELARELTK